ncbi:hypothetical protein MgSA37_04364 [Mucilaginibacter gotjawali]|uniref:Outer membrane protein transport protein n=2 Tax=Mucilaginibacter gotjawali TaxID=1550579 RepID=A0A0X8X5R0_9SPHI|nr:hypothetical protein MgSA37_04364 [Mucilaginibacter gotjawali]
MQPYTTIMIKYTRVFITILLAFFAFGAQAQSTATTSTPYSQFGLGDIDPGYLPQNIAMGGIATAINRINLYNNINPLNPASYGMINFTTIDAGIYSNFQTFNQTGQPTSKNSNFRFSHIAFAIPVSKRSALSFGLMPYSQVGYNNVQTKTGFGSGSSVDTNKTNYINSGDGGLSKAYLGYGFGLGKHLLIGANASFIFGNTQQSTATEFPNLYGVFDNEVQQTRSVRGVNYDYGIQYSFDFGEYKTKHLVLGYSGSANTSLSATDTYIVSQYTYNSSGAKNVAVDSIKNEQGAKASIKLPQINHFGISFQNDGHFLVGADYSTGKWSALTIGGVNQGLVDSKTYNIGGQFTPDINSLRNYFARADYRLGFMYNQSYLNVQNAAGVYTNITGYAVTFGLGLPLAPNSVGSAFYKINLAGEVGQRGTTTNAMVKENYFTLHLSFVLNDKWFQQFKFE